MNELSGNTQKRCSFTGHRPRNFPWKYNESSPDCIALKKALESQILELINRGVTEFYSGMAQGVDTWAAEIILALRQEKPALSFHIVLPCEDQAKDWEPSAQERYHRICEQADSVICLSPSYYNGCMLERNKYLVTRSDVLLSVYNGNWRCGTGMTVCYAQKNGKEVIVINPRTREITHFNK